MLCQNLAGMRFTRLLVIRMIDVKNHNARWLCQCDCGKTSIVKACNLKTGNTKSCGCLRNEMLHRGIRRRKEIVETHRREQLYVVSSSAV